MIFNRETKSVEEIAEALLAECRRKRQGVLVYDDGASIKTLDPAGKAAARMWVQDPHRVIALYQLNSRISPARIRAYIEADLGG